MYVLSSKLTQAACFKFMFYIVCFYCTAACVALLYDDDDRAALSLGGEL